jgi:putative glycosyltransferase (TIGR04348 family)
MRRRKIIVITPHAAASNTGNWHTAARWCRFLRPKFNVRVAQSWDGSPCDLLIALHARRSAASIDRFAHAHPDTPLLVVLTGTDLYRDIAVDASAQRSLAQAHALVVLNRLGATRLSPKARRKAHVILQSAAYRKPEPPVRPPLRVAVVGHLRAEKDPELVFACLRQLDPDIALRVDHAGAPLDAALGARARALMAEDPRYRWHGNLPRARARTLVQRASVLLHPSRIEGGAQAVIEAITSGTPVLASRIDGNTGLLGRDHPGLFAAGDARAAARLLRRAALDATFLRRLRTASRRLAPAFTPQRESGALNALVDKLLKAAPSRSPP